MFKRLIFLPPLIILSDTLCLFSSESQIGSSSLNSVVCVYVGDGWLSPHHRLLRVSPIQASWFQIAWKQNCTDLSPLLIVSKSWRASHCYQQCFSDTLVWGYQHTTHSCKRIWGSWLMMWFDIGAKGANKTEKSQKWPCILLFAIS